MIYDGYEFCEHLIIRDVKRPLTPAQKIISIPGRNKDIFVRKEYLPGNIQVEVALHETETMKYTELKRFLAGKLCKDEPKPLLFTDEPDKYYFAILQDETGIDDLLEAGTATLNFYCPDPVAYGVERVEDITNSPKLNNQGTYESKPVIDIEMTESASYLELTLLSTGEFVRVEDSFTAGDIIHIDFDSESVSKNNIPITNKVNLNSDFFVIPKGEFQIIVSSGTATLTYSERWL